jgi:ribonuclease D
MHRKANAPNFVKVAKEDILHLPIAAYDGPIHVLSDDIAAEKACQRLCSSRILGFDTETKPAFKKGESYHPSLVQLASEDEVCIFQIQKLHDYSCLESVLSTESILKIGVAPKDDILQLQDVFAFEARGFIDLRTIATDHGLTNNGLRNLAAAVLGKRISKRAQTSNWANPVLHKNQIVYAATDAWACREIYFALKNSNDSF